MAGDESMSSIYEPLDTTKHQFRLMRMLHDRHAGIDCELATYSFDDVPEYTALSYCWTKAEATCKLRLNGKSIFVRPNLNAYLELMKEEQQTCWMFIDALCINQEDVDERSAQVGHMRSVYSQAQEVVAWLGTEGTEFLSSESLTRLQGIWDDMHLALPEVEKIYTNTQPPSDLLCLVKLLQQPYWSRIWIVQETILARSLIFRHRSLRLELSALHRVAEHLPYIVPSDESGEPHESLVPYLPSRGNRTTAKLTQSTNLLSRLLWERQRLQSLGLESSSMTIASAIMNFSCQDCTEPYDKIFGLLGLTKSRLRTDYRMEKLDLYVRVLIEGTLELNLELRALQDTASKSNVVSKRTEIAFQLYKFCQSLLFALHLDLHQPVIAHVTMHIFWLCERVPDVPDNYPRSMGDLILDEISIEHNLARKARHYALLDDIHLLRAVSWTISKATILRLKRFKARDGLMSPPKGSASSAKTYQQWSSMVEDVFRDVKTTMERATLSSEETQDVRSEMHRGH